MGATLQLDRRNVTVRRKQRCSYHRVLLQLPQVNVRLGSYNIAVERSDYSIHISGTKSNCRHWTVVPNMRSYPAWY